MADNELSKKLRRFVSETIPKVFIGIDDKGNLFKKKSYSKIFTFLNDLWYLNNNSNKEPFINNSNKLYLQYKHESKASNNYGLKLSHLAYVAECTGLDPNTILSDNNQDYNIVYEWDNEEQLEAYLKRIKDVKKLNNTVPASSKLAKNDSKRISEIKVDSVKVASDMVTGAEMYVMLSRKKSGLDDKIDGIGGRNEYTFKLLYKNEYSLNLPKHHSYYATTFSMGYNGAMKTFEQFVTKLIRSELLYYLDSLINPKDSMPEHSNLSASDYNSLPKTMKKLYVYEKFYDKEDSDMNDDLYDEIDEIVERTLPKGRE